MGRHIGPVCRLCRREGIKLFLKGTRCDSPKCAIERRDGPPGQQQYRRGKPSEYSIRLREKQKVKRYYGVFERQFRRYYEMAARRPGNTGDVLMALLERRLDNVITHLGFAVSRPSARQPSPRRATRSATCAAAIGYAASRRSTAARSASASCRTGRVSMPTA